MGNKIVITKNDVVVWVAKFPDDILSQALRAGLLSDPECIEVDYSSPIGLGWTYDGIEFVAEL